MVGNLSEQDVKRLLEEPSIENKTRTIARVAGLLEQEEHALGPRERALVEDILHVFAHDAERLVREALSAQLCAHPRLPRETALTLARDLDSVALPVIEFASCLDDADLLDIVRTSGEGKQKAVARRAALSEAVADALIEAGNESVVATLMQNDTVELSERVLTRALNAFPATEAVHRPMVFRRRLPVSIAERLVGAVAEHLQTHLATHHGLPPDVATDILERTRQRATIDLISNEEDAVELVRQLDRNGRLTISIIVRALCTGDLAFFEAALAHRAQIPVMNARVLIHDSGRLGLKALCDRAGLTGRALEVVCTCMDLIAETDYDGRPGDRERFKRRIAERLLTRVEHGTGADIDYLLARIDRFSEVDAGIGTISR